MRIIHVLIRYAKWSFALAAIASTVSGLATAGILVLVNRLLADSQPARDGTLAWAFYALCILVPLSRFGSSRLLLTLSQRAVFDLRVQLCRKILAAPLRRLEEVGAHRLMAALTTDIGSMATALTDFPLLCMNAAVVVGALVYLGWLSWQVLIVVVAFLIVGVACYQVPMRWGARWQGKAREEGDQLYEHFRATTEGTKELKVHQPRRHAFIARLEKTAEAFRKLNVTAQSIFVGAASFGQALVFVVVGLVILFVPDLLQVDREAVTGYALVLLYLMTPLQGILTTLPDLSQASVAIDKVERLGLSLTDSMAGGTELTAAAADPAWGTIDFVGVAHAYSSESGDREFRLGPLDWQLRQGEIVFIVGGNGSGKTTLMKLLAGLYVPQEGSIRLSGRPVTDENREAYRQVFSVVFSDFYLFKDLLGLDHPELDDMARAYLDQLELGHKVEVESGRLSTTHLSQGQRKRLALLTAYLENRPVYLFDEWAADQDPVYKEVFYHQILPGLKNRGKTVVVICHDDRYFGVADRLVKLENGQVVLDTTAALAPSPSANGSMEIAGAEAR